MSVNYAATATIPTQFGDFNLHVFEDKSIGKEHVAYAMGDLAGKENVLLRVHSECLTGDTLFSLRCDCGSQLNDALIRISEQGEGILLYLRQEGRGIGLANKIRAYQLQEQGADTVEANEKLGFQADERQYDMAKTMLEHLGIQSVQLMTNNPRKVKALSDMGIKVTGRLPINVGKNTHNEHYLAVKASKLNHMLD